MGYLEIARRHLINMPVGSVVKISATIGSLSRFYEQTQTGVVQITPGAYCRAIG